MPPARASNLSPNLLNGIFTSLSQPSRRWSLLRTLQSDNPRDINGELRGTASFHPLRHSSATSDRRDVVYREEGELPNTFGPGLRWTKKYIWRQGDNGGISVWFVKVKPTTKQPEAQEDEDEADYLFHNFDFEGQGQGQGQGQDGVETVDTKESMFVTPPVPPLVPSEEDTAVIMARGNHLCINDMYRTAYAFRVRPESGEVVSWSSRHVVKGPKKNQDIVNLYRMEG
ncbi:hypothetical protein IFM61392_03530 [Aspergillus lentulus]|uniref:DUF6314 domain-containing protein n=1 Tax=Aspergillus lentulus TaxID=293939 RepID=A0ABQ1A6Q6_ASPLE|nr:hypothetical protein IFM62136_04527 [Aspergillus lentulus]GFF72047.1 hypothetical protein IFM47457_03038 [Aspergillus lentulus]GFF74898.1 hypothetical protein IFM60648_04308 [Aspergillus lentulus]GFG04847.1 hypothetical protein IFM61392_03530 [Aspergillus lentulus]